MAVSILTTGLIVSLSLILSLKIGLASGGTVICYATNWPQYRPGQGKFHMSDVDPTKCTLMVFAFAKVVGNRLVHYEENDPGSHGQYRQFTDLKHKYPNMKTLLAVGGWNHGGDPFSKMTATAEGRSEFVRTTVEFLRKYSFDGLDVDWEYPKAKDKQNLVSLIQELRQAFDAESAAGRSELLLIMAVAAGLQNAIPAYDVPALNRYLNYISVMTYDYHGAWEDFTGLLAPLNSPPGDQLSMTISLNWWVQNGASKDKLHVGLALYGRTWTLDNPGDTAIGSPASQKGPTGRFTREPGVLSHYEVCERLQGGGYTKVLDPLGEINYAYNNEEWMTFEDEISIEHKVKYILDNGFAGAMVWSFDLDDFKGEFCNNGRYPLMKVIADRILNAAPNSPPSASNPRPVNAQPVNVHQPVNAQPVNAQPVNAQPVNAQPVNAWPVNAQPVNAWPVNAQPVNAWPVNAQPVNARPVNARPVNSYPVGSYPVNSDAASSPPGGIPANPWPANNNQPWLANGQPVIAIISPEALARGSSRDAQCPPVQLTAQSSLPPFIAGHTFNCPATNGKFPHQSSCEYYYFCLFQMPFRERCPIYSQYNPFTQNCECIATSTYVCPSGSPTGSRNAVAAANWPNTGNLASP